MWNKLKHMLANLDGAFDKVATVLLMFGGAMLAITVVVQVILRYVLKLPLFGLEEFSRLIAVWVYFIGAAYGTKTDSHVQGEVAARYFKTAKSRAVLKTVTWTLTLLCCLLFLYHSWNYSVWLYGTGERTTGLWWPRIYSVGSMLVGAFLMTIYSVVNLIKYWAAAVSGAEEMVQIGRTEEAIGGGS